MASFISSFRRERSLLCLALAAAITLGAAYANNAFPDAAYNAARTEDAFWQRKVHTAPAHAFNVVASGDSRVYRGFDPATLENAVPGIRAYNFGFSSGGHNPFMFTKIDALLLADNTPGMRAVILGITPHSLTPRAQANSHYHDIAGQSPETDGYIRPITIKRIKQILRGANDARTGASYDYMDNGWVRSDWQTHDTTAELPNFRALFDGNRVDQKTIDALIAQTTAWAARGITVIAYRPPTTPEMEETENTRSGFDEPAFIARFRQASGIWIDTRNGYATYDGSHLTPESAQNLTRRIAEALSGRIPRP